MKWTLQETAMNLKMRTQVIRCPSRKRDVAVTYAVTGTWFSRRYEIENCPAMNDGPASCNRQCSDLLGRPPSYLFLATNSDRM
jgi:hypothetical protein